MDFEKEILNIKERNKKVEEDKAWETSLTRKLLLLLATYVCMCILLTVLKNESPFVNSIIPTLGYFLSIQSLPFARKVWSRWR